MTTLRDIVRKVPFARKAVQDAKWRKLRDDLRAEGIQLGDSPRVEEFIRTRFGISDPDYVDPRQRPNGFIKSLESHAWWDAARFDWVPRLEAATSDILKEAMALRGNAQFRPQHDGITEKGDWNVFYLYNYGDRIEENCQRCPITASVVESIPRALEAGRIYFSVMTEGTVVKAHCGPVNTRIRCHLGLKVPADCAIRVAGEARRWEEGKCMVFDDSYEHDVWNHGPGSRLVLILDVWHPDLKQDEINAMRHLATRLDDVSRLTQAIRTGEGALTSNDWWA